MGKRGGPGRDFKYSPEIHKKIIEALRAGNYVQVTCDYAGIDTATFYKWMKRGEKGQKPFDQFFSAVREAQAQGEMKHVVNIDRCGLGRPAQYDQQGKLIQAAIDPDWKASSWVLERKFPERWGKRDQLKLYDAKNGEDFKPEGNFEKMLALIDQIEEKANNESE